MTDKPKAAILYLSRSTEKDIKNLKKSLRLLDKNFNKEFSYPVIIFHEDFSQELKEEIKRSTTSNVNFEKIKFELPSFLNEEEVEKKFKINAKENLYHPLGYRHMCRFWANVAYHHPALQNYDWYWRLDTDSFVFSKIKYDVFSLMQNNNYLYGYCIMNKEDPAWTIGLWQATLKYIKNNKIAPKFLNDFAPGQKRYMKIYYNNFEISRINFWRSRDCQQYFDYLNQLGGIYEKRWGDALIHTFSVAVFVPEQQVHHFRDINYVHAWYCNASNIFFFSYFFILRKIDEAMGKAGIVLRKVNPRLYYKLKKHLS